MCARVDVHMADPKAEKTGKPVKPDEDTRYRFIGFEVFPKKAKEFWKSDNEYKQHVERARAVKSFADWERDFSLVNVEDVTKIDRIILTVSNALLLVAVFLPWLSYRTAAGKETATWFGVFGKLGSALGGAFSISGFAGLAMLCGLVVFLGTPVLAILGLLALYRKPSSPEAYVHRLRKVLRLSYVGFGAWMLGLVLTLPGGSIAPLANCGIVGVGEKFTILTVFGLLSYGAAISLGMFLLNSVKSNDL